MIAVRRFWVKEQARDQKVSVSIIVRDHLVDVWQRENAPSGKRAALDPARQNLFITVALDALLASNPDAKLRQRTHEAYRRRLERLGLSAASTNGGGDEA